MKKRDIKELVNKVIRNGKYTDMIEKISLFGSYVYGKETEKSDIDLLIYFVPEAPIGLFELADIQIALETILGKKVDLIPSDGVSPYLKDYIFSNTELMYEK